MPEVEKALERLVGRMSTLDDLCNRGIISGVLLRKQIKSLLSSRDAGTVFKEEIESDRKAIKILSRLENPGRWRELLSKSREEREVDFYKALEIMMIPDGNPRDRILNMLYLACLPFYSGFLPLNVEFKKTPSRSTASRVSVLD